MLGKNMAEHAARLWAPVEMFDVSPWRRGITRWSRVFA
jgi:hypothetical protein